MYMTLSIFDPIANLFGWLTGIFYNYFGNYGMAIIALTIVIRGLMIPLNIKSQKSMLKTQALSSQIAELQRKYADDKEMYQQEVMKLQQESGAGGLSGCLLPFLTLFFIWPVYRIVECPLYYITKISNESIKAMAELGGMKAASVVKDNMPLIDKLVNDSGFLNKCVNSGYLKMNQMVNFDFCGLDLTLKPSISPDVIKSNPSQYIPLLLIPVLVAGTQLLSVKLSDWLKPNYKEEKLAKERAKKNPASQPIEVNPTAQSMKLMTWLFPIMMLVTTFATPASFGMYWIVSGLMGMISQFIVYLLFNKPYEMKKRELEMLKAEAFKKNKSATADGEGKAKKVKKVKKVRKDESLGAE